jgi:3-phosphoshikimate 1-carboxyvinyltransferase
MTGASAETRKISPPLTLGPFARAAGRVVLPGSKSISNRVLLLAALCDGATTLESVLDADDTDRMIDALAALGVALTRDRAQARLVVHGTGRIDRGEAHLDLGNAGTAMRPLAAVLAMRGGRYELFGSARMHERPIADLVDALRSVGCEIAYVGEPGCPPIAIGASGGTAGGRVSIRGDVSSQFLSALLLALPLARDSATRATTIELATPLVSRPYVEITINLMRRFGVAVETPDADRFVVPAGARYESPGALSVEGDASAASYFLAAGAIGGGPVRVIGVGRGSIQGDVAFADALQRQGAAVRYGDDWIEAERAAPLAGGTIDCTTIPDAAMTLAITALFARAPTRLTGIGNWRVKESDRIDAMANELRKLGAKVSTGDDWIEVAPPARLLPATIDTYDDHRIAMCFSLVALGGVPVTINDPACVRKTFPAYFDAFHSIVAA